MSLLLDSLLDGPGKVGGKKYLPGGKRQVNPGIMGFSSTMTDEVVERSSWNPEL